MTPPSPTPPARLLVVDDEAHIRNGLGWSLRLNGYDVEEAASGSEALARLYHGVYDLMILDMNMPGLDGIEVMQRAHQHAPTLAIVVLTGHATLESAIAAVKAAAADYLLKPVSMHDLAAVVARALAARAEQRQQRHVMDLMSQVVDALRKPETSEPTPPWKSRRGRRAGRRCRQLRTCRPSDARPGQTHRHRRRRHAGRGLPHRRGDGG